MVMGEGLWPGGAEIAVDTDDFPHNRTPQKKVLTILIFPLKTGSLSFKL